MLLEEDCKYMKNPHKKIEIFQQQPKTTETHLKCQLFCLLLSNT